MKQNSEISIGAKGTEYGNWMSIPVIRMHCISPIVIKDTGGFWGVK